MFLKKTLFQNGIKDKSRGSELRFFILNRVMKPRIFKANYY